MLMIYHVKCKYTAVGRKEMIYFFYLYLLDVVFAMLVVANIVPVTARGWYNLLVAAQLACMAGTFWVLLLNGFVGFQWAEDGTWKSLWFFRLSTLAIWATYFVISLCTFNGWAGLDPKNHALLWYMFICFLLGSSLIYFITQIILITSLDEYWALGPILMGFGCFVMAIVLLLILGSSICKVTQHYLDGLFLCEICMLLTVMMIYKYWDTITGEDLEYALPYLSESNEYLRTSMGKMAVPSEKKTE